MRRYQPSDDANSVPLGTIRLGRNEIYWISEQENNGRHHWVLYDGPIPEEDSDSDSEDISEDISESQEPEPRQMTLTRSPAMLNLLDTETSPNDDTPVTLRRSPAMINLLDRENNLQESDEMDDVASYMSFSTDSITDNGSIYDDNDTEVIIIDENDDDDDTSTFSEDSNTYDNVTSDMSSIPTVGSNVLNNCLNDSPITLMPYDKDDETELFIIYLKNKDGKFVKGSCLRKDEMKQLLISDRNSFPPSSIMSIYKKPTSYRLIDLQTGLSGKPTGKLIIRLPTNQIYVTYGSMKRVLNSTNKEWYALPLYGGLSRRIGNVAGIYGSSMNHGQIPGFPIYKLYTKDEIKSGVVVMENADDYPHIYFHDSMLSLFELVGNIPVQVFIRNIIDELVNTQLVSTILPESRKMSIPNPIPLPRSRRMGSSLSPLGSYEDLMAPTSEDMEE